MTHTTRQATPKPSWLAPAIEDLDLLPDSGLGFSEPDPPAHGGNSGGQDDDEARRDEELFDWL